MSHRKLPFGYKLEMGTEVIHPEEATVVKDIFNCYLAGVSFTVMTSRLQKQSIPYTEGNPWNKNMVARILEDTRYTGERGFPPIIETAIFHAVAERRKGQQKQSHRSESQKALRQLSGRRPTAKIEAQVLELLNWIIQNIDVLQEPPPPSQAEAAILQRQLDQVLMQLPVDEKQASALVQRATIQHYQAIGSGRYETERLKHIFTGIQPAKCLDPRLLCSTVSSIEIERGAVISVCLKNQQHIERRETA